MDAGTSMDLKVYSRHNCYRPTPEQMTAIQDKGVSVTLTPGINVVKLLESDTPYITATGAKAEPWVLLWIYGGRVINSKTNVEVVATWASLRGYTDVLTINVIESATLCALLFDASPGHHSGELTLSVTAP
ncbi:abc-type phosphate transport periplasmic component [Leptolyngbya sp. Heron Island J]|uniref:hypothetical protein n=1 Tax=Leptolyngbya sp. Heron Island J TaxID=1385935 RepID=UPI0003B9C040|nr:hypothetical protein [Leptolyngbya sp. Heron Island J]ESA36443.1 abc-type phosphate transport periplasmic component [Leptolyngbya sp. Heron Island J]